MVDVHALDGLLFAEVVQSYLLVWAVSRKSLEQREGAEDGTAMMLFQTRCLGYCQGRQLTISVASLD